jgi:hypothetical protein
MPVLATMRERESGRIAEAARGAVHDLGNHRQGAHRSGAYTWHEQELRKVRGAALGRRGESAVQPAHNKVFGPDIVMLREDEVRQQPLWFRTRDRALEFGRFGKSLCNAIGADRPQQFDLPIARTRGPPIGEVNDDALSFALDGGVRGVDEALKALGRPVVAASLTSLTIHPLLHDHPPSIVGDDEPVDVKIKPILKRGAIDLGDEPARSSKVAAFDAHPLADRDQFDGRCARMLAASAADVDAQFT